MAIISAGYDGTVDEVQFARMIPMGGASEYGVDGAGDLKVTAVAGQDRTVNVAAGTAWGRGVRDVMDANVTVQLGTVAAGSRWDMIVLRRDWQPVNGTTSIVVIPGGSAKSLPTRNFNPGVIDDQPLALVRVQAGSTAIQEIADLRVWARNGGATANDDLVRSYLNQMGTVVEVNGVKWRRKLGANNTTVWVDDDRLNDTGWLSTGVAIPSTGFRFRGDSYKVRVRNGEVIARLDMTYINTAKLLVDEYGNVPDTNVTKMPAGYLPSVAPWPVQIFEPGSAEWFGRIEDDGSVVITHGIPGQVLQSGDSVRFIMRYPID